MKKRIGFLFVVGMIAACSSPAANEGSRDESSAFVQVQTGFDPGAVFNTDPNYCSDPHHWTDVNVVGSFPATQPEATCANPPDSLTAETCAWEQTLVSTVGLSTAHTVEGILFEVDGKRHWYVVSGLRPGVDLQQVAAVSAANARVRADVRSSFGRCVRVHVTTGLHSIVGAWDTAEWHDPITWPGVTAQ